MTTTREIGTTNKGELTTLARGGSLTLFGVVVNAVLAFALVAIISRALLAQGAGVIFEAIALFTICANLCDLGATTGLVKTIPAFLTNGRSHDIRSVLRLGMTPPVVLAVVLACGLGLFAPQLARVFIHGAHESAGITDIRLLAPFLPLSVLATAAIGATRGLGTMAPSAWIFNVGVPVLRVQIVIAVILIAGGLESSAAALAWGLPLAWAAITSLLVLRGLLATRAPVALDTSNRSPRHLAGEFWGFAAPRGVAQVFQVTVVWLDVLLVGALRSSREAAIYAVASRYAAIGTLGLAAIGTAIAPQVSRLFTQRRQLEAHELFQTGTLWIVAMTWPILLTMAVFAPGLMALFGRSFSSGATALSILSLSMLWLTGTGNSGVALLMAGKSSWTLAITATSVTTNIVLNLVLIPRLGIVGAAWAWAATIVVGNGLTVAALAKAARIVPWGRGYILVGGSAAALFGLGGLVVRLTIGTGLMAMFCAAVVASLLFAAILWRVRGMLHLEVFGSLVRHRLV